MLQKTRLNPLRHNSSADPGFFGDGPNWLTGGMERLDTVEHRLTHGAARLPVDVMAFIRGGRQKRTAGKSADAAHMPLDRRPQILKQMEAVSNLPGLRGALPNSLRIEPTAVSADDLDLWMSPEPSRRVRRGAVRQHVHDIPALQIHDDRSIGKPLAPGPVVDSCDPNWRDTSLAPTCRLSCRKMVLSLAGMANRAMSETLAEKICTPCRGGIPPLTRDEAQRFLAQTPHWELGDDAHRIQRTFRFQNFREALAFVHEAGELAETAGHHPDISFGWGYATVSLSTKKIKGLHENDFIMASKIDQCSTGRAGPSAASSGTVNPLPIKRGGLCHTSEVTISP